MDQRPIGIFDSGIGGITVVRHIYTLLPQESIVYLGDSAHLPYGAKTQREICQFARDNIQRLQAYQVKYLIAACGTISAIFSEEKSSKLSVPYTGIILPAVEKACAITKTKEIVVLGTQASVQSGAYQKAISSHIPGATVYGIACPDFVLLAEQQRVSLKDKQVRAAVETYLNPILKTNADTLILGCTHFPLLRDAIQEVVGRHVTLVDPGKEVAQFTAAYLKEKGKLSEKKQEDLFLTSGDPAAFKKNLSFYLGETMPRKIQSIQTTCNQPKHNKHEKVWIEMKSRFSSSKSDPQLSDGFSDEMKFSIEGKLKEENETLHLSYRIFSEDGKASQTTLTISPNLDTILIRTRGRQEYDLTLTRGAVSVSNIREGSMKTQMNTLAKKIEGDLTKHGGTLLLQYDLLCGEILLTHNEIEMNVKKKG